MLYLYINLIINMCMCASIIVVVHQRGENLFQLYLMLFDDIFARKLEHPRNSTIKYIVTRQFF